MIQSFDVCIRGAGIVGRTLALLLARERLRVALIGGAPARALPDAGASAIASSATADALAPVDPDPDADASSSAAAARATHEGPPSGHSDVRAYALNAASHELLSSLRSWPDAAAATPVRGMQVFGDDGGAVTFEQNPERGEPLAFIVDVPALEALLAEAVRYQPLIEPLAADASSQSASAPLTVICEGRASASRDALSVRYDVTPYGQYAIATRVVAEKPHGAVARQWFDDGRILALLPLGGADGNALAVVWSVAEAEMPQLMALLPEEFAARLEEESYGVLGKLAVTHDRATWPLQLAQAARWIGRFDDDGERDNTARSAAGGKKKPKPSRWWALAGDAAHTVHPLAGQGLNLGLADAVELARVLREREYWRGIGDERLLRRYERSRKAGLVAMRSATDGLQRLFANDTAAAQTLRNWGMWGFDRSGPLKAWAVRQAMGL